MRIARALVFPLLVGAGVVALVPAAGAQADETVARGRELIVLYRCGSCHTVPGVPGAHGDDAQPLTAWAHRSYIAGRFANDPATLARWIARPQSLVPGTWMPDLGVSPEDARAIAAYLFSLK